MLVCQQCGYGLYRTSTTTSKQKLNYYRCIGSDGYRRLKGPVCTNRPIRQDALDEFVGKEIIRLRDDPTRSKAKSIGPASRTKCGSAAEAGGRIAPGAGAIVKMQRSAHPCVSGRAGNASAVAATNAAPAETGTSCRIRAAIARNGCIGSDQIPSACRNPGYIPLQTAGPRRNAKHFRPTADPQIIGEGDIGRRSNDYHPPFASGSAQCRIKQRFEPFVMLPRRVSGAKLSFAFRESCHPCCRTSYSTSWTGSWSGAASTLHGMRTTVISTFGAVGRGNV